MKHWLAERLAKLLPQLAPLGLAQEEEIKRICEEEIAAWEARPSMKKKSSLRVPMTDTRNMLKQSIPVTPENRWYDEKNREWVPLALKYMAYPEEAYIEMNAPSEEVFQQQVLTDPAAIVRTAEGLLQAERWEDVVVGLALVTGRRLTEVMKTAIFHPRTPYSILFDGHLKRRDIRLAPYEIPTLVAAELVLSSWQRLRQVVDCRALTNSQVAEKYSRIVSATVNRHLATLISTTTGRDELHTHQLRAVYAAIAVYYYLPPRVAEITFMATIDGHYRLLEAADQKMKLNFASTAHYLDYKVADERRGIKLSEPGVEILAAFQQQTGEEDMPRKNPTDQARVVVKKTNKTGRSILNVNVGTKDIIEPLMEQRDKRSWDEIIVDLVEHDAIAHQTYDLLRPLADELGTDAGAPIAMLQALIAAYQSGVRSPGADQQAGQVATLLQEVAAEGESEPVVYLRKLVDRDHKYKEGLTRRFAGVNYEHLGWTELAKIRMPEAALERYRRAVDAVILHNRAQSDPLHRWYINAVVIRDLTGGRNDAVQEYLVTRQAELADHHAQYHLTPRDNRKPIKIVEEVDVSVLQPGYTLDSPPASADTQAANTETKEGEPVAQE